jgi:phospholipid transport system substrate-binding protein
VNHTFLEKLSMSQYLKRSIGLSLTAALLLFMSLAQAQSNGSYQNWGAAPPADEFVQGASPWSPRAEPASPASLLRDVVGKLTRFLDNKPNPRALAAYLDHEVAPWFDFDYMAQWAAGRRFHQLDEAQQDELTTRIKDSFLKSMAQKLAHYSQQRATFLPVQSVAPGQVTLPIAIENPANGYPSRLEFRLHQTDQGWLVFDVSANGMSALLHYRQMLGEMQRSRPEMMAPPMRRY